MVDAGGHRLEMELMGEGAPAVVFDAGMIGKMENWTTVRDSVAIHTNTVIFERAGFGRSEEGPSPRSAERLAAELHTALRNGGVAFPIVLVGHSAGGLFSRVFASMFPDDVAGLVFVDPAVEEVYDYMRESDPTRWDRYADEVRRLYDPPPGWFGQWDALQTSLDQARSSWPLPDVPMVLLSALSPAGEWPVSSDQDMEVWSRAQRELARRLPAAEHVVLPDAHHMSILQEPALRVKVLEVWARAGSQTTDPPRGAGRQGGA
jgi:pimeloyl-ACP methyl ester carboxylesterase